MWYILNPWSSNPNPCIHRALHLSEVEITLVIIFPFQTFICTGTNLSLQFCPRALADDKPPDVRPSTDSVDFDQDPSRVHLKSRFILNGVCVWWLGWVDLEQLSGKARLIYDEEQAKVSEMCGMSFLAMEHRLLNVKTKCTTICIYTS